MHSLTASQYNELQDIYVFVWLFIWSASALHVFTFGGGWINIPLVLYGSWTIYERYIFARKLLDTHSYCHYETKVGKL